MRLLRLFDARHAAGIPDDPRANRTVSNGYVVNNAGPGRGHMRRVTARLARVAGALMCAAAVVMPMATAAPSVTISGQSEQILQNLLAARNKAAAAQPSELSEILARQLLGTPYGADTLVGSATVPEQLVVELQKVDCFTYADYVEALKRAGDRDQFIASLINVRYKDGVVAFQNRKHFFTDWAASSPAIATDITASLSTNAAASNKNLNRKYSGDLYLPGLPVVPRTVAYIPSRQVDSGVVGRLRTGDYIGAYAQDGGLDVTHVGIFVDPPSGPVLRNASSLVANNKVVDSPLADYLKTVPGIVVLRPAQ
jgi:N-acetylmuramoyl-L-alanine amidase-like